MTKQSFIPLYQNGAAIPRKPQEALQLCSSCQCLQMPPMLAIQIQLQHLEKQDTIIEPLSQEQHLTLQRTKVILSF